MPLANGIPLTSSNRIPQIGEPAPVFKGTAVVNGAVREISLSDYAGKYVVLYFYPSDFIESNANELFSFNYRIKEFQDIGCEVVACSTDSYAIHLAWVRTPREQGGLGETNIPLLADMNHSIALSYGVYNAANGMNCQALFIIDDKGILKHITVNHFFVDDILTHFFVGRSVDEALRSVKLLQYIDPHNDFWSVDRKHGDKTFVPGVLSTKITNLT